MTTDRQLAAQMLRSSSRALASATLVQLQEDAPLAVQQLPESFATPRDDLDVRLLHLAAAVEFDRPALMEHAVQWYATALHHRDVPDDYLPATLKAMAVVLPRELPSNTHAVIKHSLDAALAAAASAITDLPTHLDKDAPHGLLACHFLLAVLEARGDDAMAMVKEALDAGMTVAELHDCVLQPVQRETGRMWLMGEIQVADEHFGSNIVNRVLWHAKDRLPTAPADAPTILTMGVTGDLHSFGLQIIEQRLQAAGLRVHNLGADMPAADLAGALYDREFDAVAISTTMSLQLHALVDQIQSLRAALPPATPIIVGGTPFSLVDDLHTLVGADAAATDGSGAVATIRRVLGIDG